MFYSQGLTLSQALTLFELGGFYLGGMVTGYDERVQNIYLAGIN